MYISVDVTQEPLIKETQQIQFVNNLHFHFSNICLSSLMFVY